MLRKADGKEVPMLRHSFVQMTKLTDVCGRVDYITNPKRQEHLYATYTSVKPEYWKLLSKQSQFDFWRSHQSKGKCIEGRELVIALPEHLQQEDPDKLLKEFEQDCNKRQSAWILFQELEAFAGCILANILGGAIIWDVAGRKSRSSTQMATSAPDVRYFAKACPMRCGIFQNAKNSSRKDPFCRK